MIYLRSYSNRLIENIHIKKEHVTKFLGVFIDEKLSRKQNIDIVSSKISKTIDILYKSRDVLTLERPMFPSYRNQSVDLLCKSTDWFLHDGNIGRSRVKQTMSKATIFFVYYYYVNYVNIAWASTSKSKLQRLYRCQKHAARLIYHKGRYTHASPLYNYMKTLNLFQLNIFNILCFMYKCNQNLNSPVFRNIFTHGTKTKYVLGNENYIQEPLCRTNFSQYCISFRGPYFGTKY